MQSESSGCWIPITAFVLMVVGVGGSEWWKAAHATPEQKRIEANVALSLPPDAYDVKQRGDSWREFSLLVDGKPRRFLFFDEGSGRSRVTALSELSR